jgi:hypothetical protein
MCGRVRASSPFYGLTGKGLSTLVITPVNMFVSDMVHMTAEIVVVKKLSTVNFTTNAATRIIGK